MLKCIAIDDEPIALKVIEAHSKQISMLQLIETFINPKSALDFLRSNKVDLIFLDINMPFISGIDLCEKLDKKTMVVFTTAFVEYALKGYELNIVDYLLKPITFERFYHACYKAKERYEIYAESKSIFVKDGYEVAKLEPASILYLESSDNYIKVFQGNSLIHVRASLPELIDVLNNNYIFRIHRSFAVNLNQVTRITSSHIFISDKSIPVGSMYKEELFSRLSYLFNYR